MAMTIWDPFTMLARIDSEFDELVRQTWGGRSQQTGYVPAVDMARDGADVVITLELPGVDVERDVDIEVAQGRLTIRGERKEVLENTDQGRQVLVRELRYGSFRREFALPETVGPEAVQASYDRGLLHVRIKDLAKPAVAHKVPVQTLASAERAEVTAGGQRS